MPHHARCLSHITQKVIIRLIPYLRWKINMGEKIALKQNESSLIINPPPPPPLSNFHIWFCIFILI